MSISPTISRNDGDGLSAGLGWTGVARVHDGRVSGSAVLLDSGLMLLTAAHVVDDLTLADSEVDFDINGTTITRSIMSVKRYPGATITDNGVWDDLALITLNQAAPVGAERYGLYTGTAEAGETAILAGYGQAQDSYGNALPHTGAQRRAGENTVDAIGTQLAPFDWQGSLAEQLWYDYDDGLAQHDALGQLLGSPNRGVGEAEGMITPGDSGGGLFIEQNGQELVAGINSFITRYAPADTTAAADGSVGDMGVATRVSSYAGWIGSATGMEQTPTPQPGAPPETGTVRKTVNEGEGVWFLTQLSVPAVQTCSVDFLTRDGTAQAGLDYIPTEGTVTLAPGEQWVKIWVQTLADNLVERDETLYLVLDNPHGATFPGGVSELSAVRTIIDNANLTAVTQLAPALFG